VSGGGLGVLSELKGEARRLPILAGKRNVAVVRILKADGRRSGKVKVCQSHTRRISKEYAVDWQQFASAPDSKKDQGGR